MPVRLVHCKTAASPSGLPGLDWALNPYRGCGHSCAYCYAQDVTRFEMSRPWGETVEVKVNFVQRLKRELEKSARGVYGLGTVTDPYQLLEKEHQLSRGSLELLKRAGARVSILTKSDLVLRDIDLLKDWEGAEVGMSVSTLSEEMSKLLEPGAPSPERRFRALACLASAGVSIYLMFAPVIPSMGDSDDDIRSVVGKVADASIGAIMWDKYNPKPIANSRLQKALTAKGFAPVAPHSADEVKRIDSVLRIEGRIRGIKILDAF